MPKNLKSALEIRRLRRGAEPRLGRANRRHWWDNVRGFQSMYFSSPAGPSRVSDNDGVNCSAPSPQGEEPGTRNGDGSPNSPEEGVIVVAPTSDVVGSHGLASSETVAAPLVSGPPPSSSSG